MTNFLEGLTVGFSGAMFVWALGWVGGALISVVRSGARTIAD